MSSLSRRALLARAGVAGAAIAAGQIPRALLEGTASAAQQRWPAAWISELQASMRGGVIVAGTSGYATAQAVYNARYDLITPAAIARPVDITDVQAALAWASRHDIPVSPRGGGHGYTGNAAQPHALVLDLRAIKGTAISSDGKRALIGGGALAIDAVAALAPRGLTVPTGSCPSVGLAGFSMGGGIGSLTRAHGLGTDALESLTIVTPDGIVRQVSSTSEPDLFWACRGGGGGNVGVVVSATYRTIPTVPETQLSVTFPWAAADEVLDAFLRTAPNAPRELSGDLAFTVDSSRRPPAVRYTGTYLGPTDQATAAISELLAIDGARLAIANTTHLQAVKARGYCANLSTEQCRPSRFGAPGMLNRSRFFAASSYLPGPLDAHGRDELLRAVRIATPILTGSRSVILAAQGGAVADVAPDATAYPHRAAAVMVQFLGSSSGIWEDWNARTWVRSARLHTEPFATGGAYVNYLDLDQPGWQQAFYGASLERLQAVKRQYDPDLRFRPQQGVPLPAA